MHVGWNRLAGWALCLVLVPGVVIGGTPTVEDFTRKLDYSNVKISPDGKRLSLTVSLPDYPATRNLAIVPRDDPDGGYALTELDDVDIAGHAWLSDKRIRIQGIYGDAFWNRRVRVPFPVTLYLDGDQSWPVRGSLLDTLPLVDNRVLTLERNPDSGYPDVFRVNVRSGYHDPVAVNRGRVIKWGWRRDDGQVVAAIDALDPVGRVRVALRVRPDNDAPWRTIATFPYEDVELHGVDADPGYIWVSARLEGNTHALYRVDTRTSDFGEPIHTDPDFDVAVAGTTARGLVQRYNGRPAYFEYMADKPVKVFLDDAWKERQAALDGALPDTVNDIVDWDVDERFFVVHSWSDRHPGYYHILDGSTGELQLLSNSAPWIDATMLADRKPVALTTRDGRVVRGYLTRQPRETAEPSPVLIWLNDRPLEERWSWRYSPFAQYMATRGVALLQVDLRGAVGYGKDFQVGGWREQLGATQDDLQDVVAWLQEAGLARPDRICIGGRLWGGHAALVALTESPGLFACGVLVSAPNDLVFQFKGAPLTRTEQWDDALRDQRFGHPIANRKALRTMSPLHNVGELDAPVLVVHGNRSGFNLRGHYDRLLAQLMLHRKEYSTLTVRYEDDVTPSPSFQTIYFRHVGNFVNRKIGGRALEAGTRTDSPSQDRYNPRYAESHRTR